MRDLDPEPDLRRQLAFARAAAMVASSRSPSIETLPHPLARCANAANPCEPPRLLRSDPEHHLHRTVAEAAAVHDTSFFRDARSFEVLRKIVLPRLIDANSSSRQLRIWSAACSTGQEAYSAAMLLCEYFPALADWDVRIIGTDVSVPVLDSAQRGRYRRAEVNRGLPARMLLKYLAHDGEEWEIVSQVKSMCEFQHADLCTPLPALPMFDLVLLRNVLLYLPQRERSGVFDRVRRQITRTGSLMLGAGEQAEDSTRLFQPASSAAGCFYRPAASI